MKVYRWVIMVALLAVTHAVSANPMATGMAAYISGDFHRAIKEWRPVAEAGNPIAQYHMGVIYRDGRGVDIDPEEAIRWWQMAAENGHAKAQYELGMAYRNGLGVKRNQEKSLEWLTKAALHSYAQAQYEVGNAFYLGLGVPQSNMAANYWWSYAAKLGHGGARLNLVALEKGEKVKFDKKSTETFISGGDWLYRQNPDSYTLQLISDFSNDRIRRYIERSDLHGDMAMFSALRGEKTLLSLVYGVYPDLESARKAVKQMSEEQRAGVPLIRRIRDVEGTLETAIEQTSETFTKKSTIAALARMVLENN